MSAVRKLEATILGESPSGKTCLLTQLCQNKFIETHDPTIEMKFRHKFSVDNEPVWLGICDTAGEESLSCMVNQSIHNGTGFIIVYSATSRESFDAVESYFNQIINTKETRSVGIVIAANKIDLEASREVSIKEGQSLAAKLGVAFVECSAKTRQNVVQLFTTLVQEMDRVSVTREVPQKPTKEKVAPTSTAHSTSPTTPKISKKKSSSGFGCFGRKRSKSEPASEMKDIIVKHL